MTAIAAIAVIALLGWLTKLVGELYIVYLALHDALDPHWTEIRSALRDLVSPRALAIGTRLWPPRA